MRQLILATLFALAVGSIGEGTYNGRYEGSAGASGDFRITLSKSTGGQWNGEVSFVLGNQDVKCKTTSIAVSDSKLKIVYTFDLQGTSLESQIDGELKDGKLGGKYRTQIAGDGTQVDEGTWSTSLNGKQPG